jgi:hypothetical protein
MKAQPSIIVWDLETVPDLGGFAAANDLVGKSDVEVREAVGDKFPKHIYHSIVCIGALIAWLRYELFRGTLSQNAFEASERNLGDFVRRR